MRAWEWIWTVWLIFAGVSFAVITLIVSVKGARDLAEMFRGLGRRKDDV